MIRSKAFQLTGFTNPGTSKAGFLIPVFRNRNKLYVQDVDKDDKVVDFMSFSLPRRAKIIHFDKEQRNKHIGDSALYAFRCVDGAIIVDEKERLKTFLQPRIEEFSEYAFLRIEVLEFLDMFEELLHAINDAAKKLICLNPLTAKDWKLRAYQKILMNYVGIKPIVLIVDKELQALESLEIILKDNYLVLTSENGKDALEILQRMHVDLVLLEIYLSDMDGLELLRRIKEQDEEMDVIIVSALKQARKAVDAIKLGAYDYITKPYEPEDILSTVNRVISKQKLYKELDFLRREVEESRGFDQIISQNKTMQEIFQLIKKVAFTSTNILITGESGTGKELIARSIHRQGIRKNGPFVAINCAAIPSELMESEMFGHEKGAFTGAYTRTIGKFEHANGGTLFLDEVSVLRSDLQVKLLRVLQEREIERIGSNKPIKVDFRVISATNTNLEDAVMQGKFRQDLYFRLNVVPISIPPLRERREDIPLLAKYFLDKFNEVFNKQIPGFSEKALNALSRCYWPGNIRELENLVERIVVLSSGDRPVELDDIPVEILVDSGGDIQDLENSKQRMIEAFEKRMIEVALEATNWEQRNAAKMLKIDYLTLIQKLKQYGFIPPTGEFS